MGRTCSFRLRDCRLHAVSTSRLALSAQWHRLRRTPRTTVLNRTSRGPGDEAPQSPAPKTSLDCRDRRDGRQSRACTTSWIPSTGPGSSARGGGSRIPYLSTLWQEHSTDFSCASQGVRAKRCPDACRPCRLRSGDWGTGRTCLTATSRHHLPRHCGYARRLHRKFQGRRTLGYGHRRGARLQPPLRWSTRHGLVHLVQVGLASARWRGRHLGRVLRPTVQRWRHALTYSEVSGSSWIYKGWDLWVTWPVASAAANMALHSCAWFKPQTNLPDSAT